MRILKTVFLLSLCLGFMNASLPTKKKFVVMVDAGHGGIDLGNFVPGGITEKEINLQISDLICEELGSEQEVITVRSRYADHDMSLTDRAALSESGVDLVLSIHADSQKDLNNSGVKVFISEDGINPSMARRFGQLFIYEMGAIGVDAKLVKESANYFILKKTACPSVLINVGNMNHEGDLTRMQNPDFQKLVAQACTKALANM